MNVDAVAQRLNYSAQLRRYMKGVDKPLLATPYLLSRFCGGSSGMARNISISPGKVPRAPKLGTMVMKRVRWIEHVNNCRRTLIAGIRWDNIRGFCLLTNALYEPLNDLACFLKTLSNANLICSICTAKPDL
jgi:hypothetical protein